MIDARIQREEVAPLKPPRPVLKLPNRSGVNIDSEDRRWLAIERARFSFEGVKQRSASHARVKHRPNVERCTEAAEHSCRTRRGVVRAGRCARFLG